jgi:hypothetical protein
MSVTSKSAHTPGPWEWEPTNAWMWCDNRRGLIFQVDPYGGTPPDEANGRLMAASPELLEALELFCPCDPMTPSHAEHASQRELMAWAAIQKARGVGIKP